MDILLNSDGDLFISGTGDIVLAASVAQKIRIRLLWLQNEWRWSPEEGLPYKENLLIKDPDTDLFESLIREKIFEVDEVTDVKDVNVDINQKTRQAKISFIASTDKDTIEEEVMLHV